SIAADMEDAMIFFIFIKYSPSQCFELQLSPLIRCMKEQVLAVNIDQAFASNTYERLANIIKLANVASWIQFPLDSQRLQEFVVGRLVQVINNCHVRFVEYRQQSVFQSFLIL